MDSSFASPLWRIRAFVVSLRLIEIVWDMVGFFELSSNRRDIWHGTGMVGVGQLRCDWNISLLKVSFH